MIIRPACKALLVGWWSWPPAGAAAARTGRTQATPIEYPADVPFSGTAPAGATWYEISGLTSGLAYVAGVAVQEPGPNVELDVYSALEPTPPNELCLASEDTFTSPASSPRRVRPST